MDPIRDAFIRAKQDILDLKLQLQQALEELHELKRTINQSIQQIQPQQQTNTKVEPTGKLTELNELPLYTVKSPIYEVSSGNRGVPTNQPTIQQTNQHIGNRGVETLPLGAAKLATSPQKAQPPTSAPSTNSLDRLEKVGEILSSLDAIKKDLRAQFKRLTAQEMHIFALVYQLEEQGLQVDYTLLASKTGLTEISIRDYLRKLTKKGIPVVKTKFDNKKILLSIPSEFKQIASLQTILTLREL